MPRFKTKLEEEEFHVCNNSIERVINTSIHILQRSKHEDVDMSLDDWENLKWIVVRLWNEERNRIFKKRMEQVK